MSHSAAHRCQETRIHFPRVTLRIRHTRVRPPQAYHLQATQAHGNQSLQPDPSLFRGSRL